MILKYTVKRTNNFGLDCSILLIITTAYALHIWRIFFKQASKQAINK